MRKLILVSILSIFAPGCFLKAGVLPGVFTATSSAMRTVGTTVGGVSSSVTVNGQPASASVSVTGGSGGAAVGMSAGAPGASVNMGVSAGPNGAGVSMSAPGASVSTSVTVTGH